MKVLRKSKLHAPFARNRRVKRAHEMRIVVDLLKDGRDLPMSTLERRRLAEAAFIYSTAERLSPRQFADRIMRHPRSKLRDLRSGNRPISRRAIENLIAGKMVRQPTLDAVRSFICAERGLPETIYKIDPVVVRMAKLEMARRLGAHPSRASLQTLVGKYNITMLQSDVWFEFDIELEPESNVVLCRGVAFFKAMEREPYTRTNLSGYVVPSRDHVMLMMSDHQHPESYILILRRADQAQAGGIDVNPERMIFHQSAHPVQLLLPDDLARRVSRLAPIADGRRPALNLEGGRWFEQEAILMPTFFMSDTFDLGKRKFNRLLIEGEFEIPHFLDEEGNKAAILGSFKEQFGKS